MLQISATCLDGNIFTYNEDSDGNIYVSSKGFENKSTKMSWNKKSW